jgi:hypothetical protein
VDLSPEMMKYAADKGLNTDIQDVRQLKEKNNSYDVVICLGNSIGGILNIEDRLKAIKEMTRVSRRYVIIDYNNRWAHLREWIPIYLRKIVGKYHAGIKINPNVITGNNLGDIIWYDEDIGDILYHYIYTSREICSQMKVVGLNVSIYPSKLAQTPIIIGYK